MANAMTSTVSMILVSQKAKRTEKHTYNLKADNEVIDGLQINPLTEAVLLQWPPGKRITGQSK